MSRELSLCCNSFTYYKLTLIVTHYRGKLWNEKSKLESIMWENKSSNSTNPFDDDEEDVFDYPTVGTFWHDQPQNEKEKTTTNYCVVLLGLIQLLGRGESWRMSRMQTKTESEWSNSSSRRRGPGNPLARELAIDLGYTLLHLDRTDMRVRLLIPSLLLEGEYYQEAYDFLKHWLQIETNLMLMDLALLGGLEDSVDDKKLVSIQTGADMLEPLESWMDAEILYPSIGMVFELAFLKCHMLCSLRSNNNIEAFGVHDSSAVDEGELETEIKLLLSVVHQWNPHLLPSLGERYWFKTGSLSPDDDFCDMVAQRATPPALSLLNKQPPGFELQFKMGNPGGKSLDEAVSIWQRDMICWHVVNPDTMMYLSQFCSNLEKNLVDISCLNGGKTKPKNEQSVDDAIDETDENILKRKEAEELVSKLRTDNPSITMEQIMMHPEMAQLMIKHLHTE